MKKALLLIALLMPLVACKKEASREVILAESPDGHQFHFMPIYEDGVTDITITIAWPMTWAFAADAIPAAPYIASEAILSGGTKELAPQNVLEIFNDKNAHGQLYVRADYAIGELSLPKEHVDDVISIAGEMLASPQFDPAWIDRIKQGLLANQTQSAGQTAAQMWALARLAILGDTPVNEFLSLSDLPAIEAATEDDLRRWHRETIVKTGATIAITGAISSKDAGKALDKLLSGLPDGNIQTPLAVQADFAPKVVLLHLPDAEKTTLGIVGQLPPTSQGGDLTDHLALSFFGQPGSGPLFDAVRTDLRASYGFQAGFTNFDRNTRFMFIAGEVETSKLADAVDVVRATYENFRTAPDLTGLDELRHGMAEGTSKNVLYVDVVARTMLELALDSRDPAEAPRLGDLLANTSARQVQDRLATIYPTGDDLIVFAASPDANALPGACVVTAIEQVAECP